MRLGAINLIRSSRESIKIAQAAEAAGFWGLGMGDTVPKLYQDTYVTAAACFAATERLHIGPTVTNTVTRHWSVLGRREAGRRRDVRVLVQLGHRVAHAQPPEAGRLGRLCDLDRLP